MNNADQNVLSQEQNMFPELLLYQEHRLLLAHESILGFESELADHQICNNPGEGVHEDRGEQSVSEADANAAASARPKPKPRLKWTTELHENFVRAVDELGGPNKATPSAILRLMNVVGLKLPQVKSHLQKFRHKISKRLQLGNNTSTADNSHRRTRKEANKVHGERGSSSHTNPVPIRSPQQQERGLELPNAHGCDLHEVVVAGSSTMNVAETLEEVPVVPTTTDTVIQQPLFPLPVPDSGLADGHVSSSLCPNKAPEIKQEDNDFSFWDFHDDMGSSSSSVFHYHSKGKVEDFPEFDESLWNF